ncbi:MAG: hypothetical protein EXR73_00650 [Myxococcales bacterium]|nr:hypothetical protein [Myxococcales bacterium]
MSLPRAAMVLLAVGLLGCGGAPAARPSERRGEVAGRVFEFATGGAYAEDGDGEWMLRVRGRSLWIAVDRAGEIVEFGAFRLAPREAKKLWRLVDALELGDRSTAGKDRPSPTVRRHRFVIGERDEEPVVVWMAPAAEEDEATGELLAYCEKLIRRHARASARLGLDGG